MELRTLVTYEVGGLMLRARAANISERGLFIETALPADSGALLRLRFKLEGHRLEAEGRVVRATPHMGMGIEFTRISDDHRSIIRALVAGFVPELVGTQA